MFIANVTIEAWEKMLIVLGNLRIGLHIRISMLGPLQIPIPVSGGTLPAGDGSVQPG